MICDMPASSAGSLSHPNSGLPEFGTLSWPKADESDFGWERGGVRGYGLSMAGNPLTPALSPSGERERTEFVALPAILS
jgi:hypothetical protein